MKIQLKPIKKPSPEATLSIILGFIISLLAYLSTLAPGLVGIGDTPKFQFIGLVNGIPHSTGYPLYILVSKGFIYLFSPQNSAFATNFMSAFFAVLTVCLVSLAIIQLTKVPIYGLIVSLTLALSYTFWSQAIIAEVYSLNAFFVSLFIWFVIKWEETDKINYFYLAWTAICVGLGNHATLIFFAFSLLMTLLLTHPKILTDLKQLAILSGVGSIVFIQYGWLFYLTQHNTLYSEFEGRSWSDFVAFLAGSEFQHRYFGEDFWLGLQTYIQTLHQDFSLVFIGLAIIGLIQLVRRPNKVSFVILISLCVNLVFTLTYRIEDIASYYIPSFVLLTLCAGVGINFLVQKVTESPLALPKRLTIAFICIIFASLLIPRYVTNSISFGDWFIENQKVDKLRKQLAVIPPESVVFTPSNRQWWQASYLKFSENFLPQSKIARHTSDLPANDPFYATVEPNLDPQIYDVEAIPLENENTNFYEALLSSDNEDILILAVNSTVSLKVLPDDVLTLLQELTPSLQELTQSNNVILIGNKNTQLNEATSNLRTGDEPFKVGRQQQIVSGTNVVSPVQLEVVTEEDRKAGTVLRIKVDHQTVLRVAKYGLIILDAGSGKIKKAGLIDGEDLSFDPLLLYKVQRQVS